MFDPKNKIWTEKYRPKKVKDVVGEAKTKILKYLEKPDSIPSFLFYSSQAGTGKTSLAKAIINELGCDALVLNSSDDRTLEVVREEVKNFAMTQSTNGMKRCIFMDEFDGNTKIAQDALRNVMETYSFNVFFILTANNVNKVIPPIQSRCVMIQFSYPEKEDIYNYLEEVCKAEDMDYTEEGIKTLIDKNYPSIRNCVIALQDLYTIGLPVLKENVKPAEPMFEHMWQLYLQKKQKELFEEVLKHTIHIRELNKYFWYKAARSEPQDIRMIQLCAHIEDSMARGSDETIIFATKIFDMVKT